VALLTVPLVSVVASTARSRLLTLKLQDRRFSFLAGQAVSVAPHGDSERKPYSIACSPERVAATGELELLIAFDTPS
jgi:NAD(P)H-flavin reductase